MEIVPGKIARIFCQGKKGVKKGNVLTVQRGGLPVYCLKRDVDAVTAA